MCCGQKRTALRNSLATVKTQVPSQRPPNSTTAQTARLQASTAGSVQTVPNPAPSRGSRHAPAAIPPFRNSNGSLTVRYVGHASIRFQSLQTGRSYEFSGAHSVRAVDARDAATLLATRLFRRA